MLDSPFGHPAWVELDLEQFISNIAILKSQLNPGVRLCLPVKANAYGHGLVPMAQAAVHAGVDYLAVSCLSEGARLRHAGLQCPILVLGAIHEQQIPELIQHALEFTIASFYKARLVAAIAEQLQKVAPIHLEIETGMQRTGVRVETAWEVLEYLHAKPCFALKGIYSHLATADITEHPFTHAQIERFSAFVRHYQVRYQTRPIFHLSNSAGLRFPEIQWDMVRPGLLGFGYQPNRHDDVVAGVRSCFAVRARIAYCKTVAAGHGISYNHSYKTREQTRIITLPLGYGDGLRRALSNRGHVLLKGQAFPIVGHICMDQCMVDVGQNPAYVGDVVTLLGEDCGHSIRLEEMAGWADTIIYEILCGFNDRLPRLYRLGDSYCWEQNWRPAFLSSQASGGDASVV